MPRDDHFRGLSERARARAGASVHLPHGDEISKVLGEEVFPRLASGLPSLAAKADALLYNLFQGDVDTAWAVVDQALDQGAGLSDVLLRMLAPAASALGDLWTRDRISFVDATLAVGTLQRFVQALADRFEGRGSSAAKGRVALVAPAPGEGHVLGAAIAAAFLRYDSWSVETDFAATRRTLGTRVATRHVDVVGLSLAGIRQERDLARDVAEIRSRRLNARMLIVAGGQAVETDPALPERVGADAAIRDLPGASAKLLRMIGARDGHRPARRDRG